MPRRVMIVQGHPDPGGKRLCHALADACAAGAAVGGHELTGIEVASLDFPILRM
jgi:putative NADPH-quinone reductase